MARFAPKGIALALLAGLSVLAAQVPEELFERAGWDYGLYQIVVFSVFTVSILLLGVVWLVSRATSAQFRRGDALCEAALTHLAIMYARGEDPGKPGHFA